MTLAERFDNGMLASANYDVGFKTQRQRIFSFNFVNHENDKLTSWASFEKISHIIRVLLTVKIIRQLALTLSTTTIVLFKLSRGKLVVKLKLKTDL